MTTLLVVGALGWSARASAMIFSLLGLGEAAGTEVRPHTLRIQHHVGALVPCLPMNGEPGYYDAGDERAVRLLWPPLIP